MPPATIAPADEGKASGSIAQTDFIKSSSQLASILGHFQSLLGWSVCGLHFLVSPWPV
jgi:hypothetical protein